MQKTCPICKRFIKSTLIRHDACYEKKKIEVESRLEEVGFSQDVSNIMAAEIVFTFVYQGHQPPNSKQAIWDFEKFCKTLDLKEIEKKAIDFNLKLEKERKEVENDIRNQRPKQLVMDIRGGAREGAGRKRKGTRKPVSINLPDSEWQKIQTKIDNREFEGFSDYFSSLHLKEVTT